MDVAVHETPHGRWEVASRAPPASLRPYLVRSLEGWSQAAGAGGLLREVPFPGVPLILNLGDPWLVEGPGGRLERRDSFAAGLHTVPAFVRGPALASCVELRLTPLGARRVLGVPMHELANRTVPLEELLPGARVLCERLRETPSWARRFELVELYLARCLADSAPPAPGVAWAWRRLVRSGGRASIATLADELGWSPRRLIGRFREHVGLAPKAAARVIRFNRAVAVIRSSGAVGLAGVAFDCGYFDQAHLNRDFRELAGTTPTAFAASQLATGGIAA